ncbi:MAG: UDP-N-acetylglucosamine 1-carboxyvinyltransferase, partial [Anaerotignaceae bacterium]
HLGAIISKLKEANAEVEVGEDTIHVYTKGEINAVDVKTMPYPGFPTDLQAVFMTLSAMAKGSSVITETVFENRFLQAGELVRMGADIKTEGRVAIVDGVKKLTGTSVKATDLRAGAALVLAALAAEGESVVSEIFHIERGYCALETKLSNLGANIKKID